MMKLVRVAVFEAFNVQFFFLELFSFGTVFF